MVLSNWLFVTLKSYSDIILNRSSRTNLFKSKTLYNKYIFLVAVKMK